MDTVQDRNCQNCCEKHLYWLLEHLGPVIYGVKPAEILSYRNFDCERCQKICRIEEAFDNAKNIKYRKIKQINNEIKIFFYNPNALEKHLLQPMSAVCLKKFHYPVHRDMERQIDELVRRIERVQQGECPHEIGVFLGYPIKDVLGYLGWSSKELTKVRCWRVYGDETESDQLYEQIISMRQRIRNIISSCTLNEVLQSVV